ncbi:hypothetical protein DCCM_4484 [Desulfocucumis palustris]|uniref:Copper amine oxidase-like N-terminal domain-containing protein n=1 Tax=Desulfocucumis palustris TaxID=1898651 RepID=A0A2L2XN34_9FIRM|nr:copper amine oxidase N-terminal domain-containing protein [Desulfocucumis palustris]GBF35361.1 hypothetical protein DCCM_4484 [Desulfocucumis palustris]
MKNNSKLVSFTITFFVLAALVLFWHAPGAYAEEAEIYVDDEVVVSDNAPSYNFGRVFIVEDDESSDAFKETPVHITFTLVDGVEFPDDADFSGMLDKSSTVKLDRVISSSKISVTFSVYGSSNVKDKAVFDFGELEIQSSFEGDVEVEIESLDSLIPSDTVLLGEVLPEEIDVSEVSTSTLVVGDVDVATGIVRITETVAGSLNGGVINVTLPEGIKFSSKKPFSGGGTLANLVGQDRIDPKDGSTNWELNGNRDKLKLYLANKVTNKRGFLDLTFNVNVDFEAEPGDVFIDLEGDETNNIPLNTLYVAKLKDVGVTVNVAGIKTITAGTWDEELGEINIVSSSPGSLIGNRYIVAELDNARFVGEPSRVRGLTLTENTGNKLVWKLEDTPRGEYALNNIRICTAADTIGEVTINFTGTAGLDEIVTVANVMPPVVVNVEGFTGLKAGVQSQPFTPVLVRESGAGAIMADSADMELSLRCPDGVKFAARPMAAVVEGDIVLDNNGYVYLRDRGNDGTFEEAYLKIEKAGTVPSAIRFANIMLDVYSDCPDGPIELSVGGSSLVEEETAEVFGDDVAARAVVGQIFTTVPLNKSNGIFWVGKSYYNQNESLAMAGVAPYIKDGRVYLPLRNVAYLYGLTERDITWDQATQTVNLTGGGYSVVMNIGKNEYKLNGADMRMEVPPEIYNGHTMVPARYLVEALGGKITWNDQLKAIYIQFK